MGRLLHHLKTNAIDCSYFAKNIMFCHLLFSKIFNYLEFWYDRRLGPRGWWVAEDDLTR
jgi:hypothetical protein